jgi:hypothetical protein
MRATGRPLAATPSRARQYHPARCVLLGSKVNFNGRAKPAHRVKIVAFHGRVDHLPLA